MEEQESSEWKRAMQKNEWREGGGGDINDERHWCFYYKNKNAMNFGKRNVMYLLFEMRQLV